MKKFRRKRTWVNITGKRNEDDMEEKNSTEEGHSEKSAEEKQTESPTEKRQDEKLMDKRCIAFSMKDPNEALEHMHWDGILIKYGGFAYGHCLYTWDDGERFLVRCSNCGGYILVQKSEFHSFSDGDDDYYVDYFPVDSPEEVDRLNREFDGFTIEQKFPERFLMRTNLYHVKWSIEE